MPRLLDLTSATLTPEQRTIHDEIAAGPRGAVVGPLRVWLNNPGLARPAQALGAYCRYGTALEPRLSELAILITGAHWRSGFEWATHAPIGIAADLDAAVVEALRFGQPPAFARNDESVLHAFCAELLATREVSDTTYHRALALLGQTGVIDLVGLLGYYTLISMTINVFEVPLPAGTPDPFG